MAATGTGKRDYKGFTPRMGVYAVRHLPSGRTLLGSSLHLQGILNRHRFQLETGVHAQQAMQADWRRDGRDAFAFEILDELKPLPDRPDHDPSSDLAELEALWRERLGLTPQTTYAR
ncbi:GIY-YIG nuclease family protein [Vulgatibacter sp.]|uniref:GIY-YIG nuclease family protein n=1 Tax=Vulgatibacter sp. TaxID=1971226 RepID=UPI003569D7F7